MVGMLAPLPEDGSGALRSAGRAPARAPGPRRPDPAGPSSRRRSGRRPLAPCRRGPSGDIGVRRDRARRRRLSSAPSSDTTPRPRAATTSAGSPSPARTPSSTWRAMAVVDRAGLDQRRPARRSGRGVTPTSASSTPAALARRARSPPHHLRAADGRRAGSDRLLSSSTAPEFTTSRISRSVKPQSACSRLRCSAGGSGSVARSSSTQAGVGRERHEVGLREVAVVLGVRLDPARGGDAGVLVEVPRLLDDQVAGGQPGRLPGDLVADRPLDAAQRVDVLGLGAGAQRHRRLPLGNLLPEGDVGVAAQRTLVHPDVADAQRPEQVAQRA